MPELNSLLQVTSPLVSPEWSSKTLRGPLCSAPEVSWLLSHWALDASCPTGSAAVRPRVQASRAPGHKDAPWPRPGTLHCGPDFSYRGQVWPGPINGTDQHLRRGSASPPHPDQGSDSPAGHTATPHPTPQVHTAHQTPGFQESHTPPRGGTPGSRVHLLGAAAGGGGGSVPMGA